MAPDGSSRISHAQFFQADHWMMQNPSTAAPVAPPPADPEAEVEQMRRLVQSSRFAEALEAAGARARRHPSDREALYMMAVSLRYLGRIDEALVTLQQLETYHRRFSLLFQERGHCHVTRKDAPAAIEAYLRAVNLNPALPASWSKLQVLFRMTGRMQDSATAGEHVATLSKLPPEVVTATALFSDGDLAPAEQMIRQFLLRHGDHIEGMRLLARIGLELDVADDAVLLLEAVLKVAPDYHAARYDYARALLKQHRHVDALHELDTLIKADPGNRTFLTTYATAVVGKGDHRKALELYQQLLAGVDRAPDLHLSIAHTYKTLGRSQEAIASYREAARQRPDFGDAYWSLANLKTYRFSDEEITRMREAERASGTALADRYHLCFALGKAYEDRCEYGESFAFYERGNALKKSESRYRPETTETNARLQRQVCTAEFFAQRRGVGCAAPDPIFIVGLPRSGSTLLEQILASHSQVEGTMELADIPRIVQELQGRESITDAPERLRYPRILAQLDAGEFTRLGEKYLHDTRAYRTGKAFFIDKMPNNFRHIGLIHLMLPNAKIIDARREPMACCFSNFKQLFASGQEFTYGIEDIARYYRSYVELMAHWDTVLPGRILRVQHEEVVDDLEGNVRRLLDFCGLPFESACLEFHKTERSIRTASSEQVRRPIFKEGLDQWKHFEPWLGALKSALGPLTG